jgi:glycosyltransferase involved in cell wall biosynthesis
MELDGIQVRYVRYLSPPRPISYRSWGMWAAPSLARALKRIRGEFPFELIHAHYAVPAGDAVRRVAGRVPAGDAVRRVAGRIPAGNAVRGVAGRVPLVVSVHGHDVQGVRAGGRNVRSTLAAADLVLANSAGTARRCIGLGARATRVVHLGTDLPAALAPKPRHPTLVTVAHLAARKRHADVIAAVSLLRGRQPGLRYQVVGDGPERRRLEQLAHALVVDDLIDFRGQLPHEDAVAAARGGSLFVLPSVDEAFGVAYVEAMGGEVPAIGCRGEDGPEEIAAAGGGIALVPPRDPEALAAQIDSLLRDDEALDALGVEARETVEREFTWEQCGRETVEAYERVLGPARGSGREAARESGRHRKM